MSRLLLDTHIWIWYLLRSPRLPAGLRKLLDRSVGACWLSPISVWEAALLVRRGRLEILGDYRQWVATALSRLPLQEASLNFEVALKSQEVRLSHGDPADHFLAATALVYDLTLVTVDERLMAAEGLPTRSR